jgi:hypothetical protein
MVIALLITGSPLFPYVVLCTAVSVCTLLGCNTIVSAPAVAAGVCTQPLGVTVGVRRYNGFDESAGRTIDVDGIGPHRSLTKGQR